MDPDIWEWPDDTPTNRGFLLTNGQIYNLLKEKSTEWVYLNKKWRRDDNKLQWTK